MMRGRVNNLCAVPSTVVSAHQWTGRLGAPRSSELRGPAGAPAIVKMLQPLSEYTRLASENASTTYASVSNMGFPQQLPRCSCPAPPGN